MCDRKLKHLVQKLTVTGLFLFLFILLFLLESWMSVISRIWNYAWWGCNWVRFVVTLCVTIGWVVGFVWRLPEDDQSILMKTSRLSNGSFENLHYSKEMFTTYKPASHYNKCIFFLILQLRWPIESTFSQTVILCICWDTPSEKTGIWQLPKVSSAFKVCFHFARHISPCSLFIKPPRRRLLAPVAYDAQHAGFFESVEPTAVSTHNKHVIDMIPTLRNNITIYHKVYLPSSWHRLVK